MLTRVSRATRALDVSLTAVRDWISGQAQGNNLPVIANNQPVIPGLSRNPVARDSGRRLESAQRDTR
jgi:hypothetical protein